jgi:hypothetical protein
MLGVTVLRLEALLLGVGTVLAVPKLLSFQLVFFWCHIALVWLYRDHSDLMVLDWGYLRPMWGWHSSIRAQFKVLVVFTMVD